ncbi:metaxin-1-like [Ylistrum balloti]|uniref:metaxin-1-like n=1 Tax=Ylistrum balloti TaxID=509963 RepID=UPI002905AE56|nr:metaxin-1-like [Ylistrum balloti]
MADDVLELDIWGGDWELPSVDPDCLTVLAFAKFCGVPCTAIKRNNPVWTPSGTLPVLRNGNKSSSRMSEMLEIIRKKSPTGVTNQVGQNDANIKAFTSLLEQKLLPAVLHTWWLDDQTYVDVTRPWYAHASPFPLNFYIPGRLQRTAASVVYMAETVDPDNVTREEIVAKIYKDAKECLNHLSYRLGEQDFFFGSLPSELDAKVVGYLAPLLNAPIQTNRLINHLKACTNLCTLCNRVLMRYFPLSPEESEIKRKREEEKRQKMQIDSLEFPNKKRNIFFAALFAAVAMISYALTSGLVKFETEMANNPDYADDDYYEEEDENG